MIIYFCDRNLSITGQASTSLPGGFRISEDLTVEEIESGVNTFSCKLSYNDRTRDDLESAVQAGRFILKQGGRAFSDKENIYDSLYQIVETEFDTKSQELYLYAEDAGLDLLNKVCSESTQNDRTLTQMLNAFKPSDWVLNLIGTPTGTKTYTWDGESTCTERLMSVAQLFNCEIYYSFVIERLSITAKVINVVNKRGNQTAVPQLRLNRDIDRIVTKTSIAELATAYTVTGGTPDGSNTPVNLKNYSYTYTDPDTGDVYSVDSTTGQMRNTSAMKRWASALDSDGLILKTFSYDTTNKATLAGQARAALQKASQISVNYEVDFARLPDDIRIGDRVNIIDEDGEVYLEARMLKIESCAAEDTQVVTIGEFLLKDSGINEQVIQTAREAMQSATAAKTVANNTLLYDHTYTCDTEHTQASFQAQLYRGGVDIHTEFPEENFLWYYKTEDGELIPILHDDGEGNLVNTGYTCEVNLEDMGYGGHVLGKFVTTEDSQLLTRNGDSLTNSNNRQITVRTETGESVRVSDLTVETTLYSTDKLMAVGAEDEHLITVQTLQNYLNANLDKNVLFNTTSGWNSQTTLQSAANTLYVYTDHQTDANNNNIAGIKVGDGNAYVVDLPFIDAIAMEHISDTDVHVTSEERTFWNNKVRCYYAGTEQLIFTTS